MRCSPSCVRDLEYLEKCLHKSGLVARLGTGAEGARLDPFQGSNWTGVQLRWCYAAPGNASWSCRRVGDGERLAVCREIRCVQSLQSYARRREEEVCVRNQDTAPPAQV
jgi:hypothetical protein